MVYSESHISIQQLRVMMLSQHIFNRQLLYPLQGNSQSLLPRWARYKHFLNFLHFLGFFPPVFIILFLILVFWVGWKALAMSLILYLLQFCNVSIVNMLNNIATEKQNAIM